MRIRNALQVEPPDPSARRPAHPSRNGLLGVVLLVLAGCATAPERPAAPAPGTMPPARAPAAAEPAASPQGRSVLSLAERMVGAPYRFGGATEAGFDCSGLVFYVHRELGLSIARTARAQFESARAVDPDELQVGDLVFFRLGAAIVDHVGIYAGARRFIHAPRTGQSVRYDSLDEPYFSRSFAGARRAY